MMMKVICPPLRRPREWNMGRSAAGLSPALLSLLLSLSLYSPFVPSHLFSKFLLHLLYVPFLSFCFISIIIIIVCFLSLSSTLPHLFYAPFILSRLFFPSFVSLPIFSTFISSCLFPLSIYRFYKLLFVLFSFCFLWRVVSPSFIFFHPLFLISFFSSLVPSLNLFPRVCSHPLLFASSLFIFLFPTCSVLPAFFILCRISSSLIFFCLLLFHITRSSSLSFPSLASLSIYVFVNVVLSICVCSKFVPCVSASVLHKYNIYTCELVSLILCVHMSIFLLCG